MPRTTDSPEQLDLLLVMVAAPRVVHRDGIRFQGVRYLDPTLAAYVGERVTIRYDPRDMAEIRVYHRDRFLCRAVSPAHASQTVTLKDIQAARVAHRRALRAQLDRRHAAVREYLPLHGHTAAGTTPPVDPPTRPGGPSKPQLFTYQEDVQ
jgi:putative transposase